GLAEIEYGDASEGVRELEAALALAPGGPMLKAALGYGLGRAGRKDEARKILAELQKEAAQSFFPPYLLAEVSAGLDDKEAALTELERAVAIHDTHLVFLSVDPVFKTLRAEPRFAQLLHELRFDAVSSVQRFNETREKKNPFLRAAARF